MFSFQSFARKIGLRTKRSRPLSEYSSFTRGVQIVKRWPRWATFSYLRIIVWYDPQKGCADCASRGNTFLRCSFLPSLEELHSRRNNYITFLPLRENSCLHAPSIYLADGLAGRFLVTGDPTFICREYGPGVLLSVRCVRYSRNLLLHARPVYIVSFASGAIVDTRRSADVLQLHVSSRVCIYIDVETMHIACMHISLLSSTLRLAGCFHAPTIVHMYRA